MTKGIAKLALAAISIGLMLGNYWFTFGLWPRSWSAFMFFAVAIIGVSLLNIAIDQDKVMTPLAASVVGYVLGLVTAAFIVAIVLLFHGGRSVRDEDQRRAERMSTKGRGW
jgi:uncharacterized membrane protein